MGPSKWLAGNFYTFRQKVVYLGVTGRTKKFGWWVLSGEQSKQSLDLG